MRKHDFHLVDRSPWPTIVSIQLFSLAVGLVCQLQGYLKGNTLIILSSILIGIVVCCWWRDVIREATYLGEHTVKVVGGLSLGISLFIISECLLFFGLFWAYLHSAFNPSVEFGLSWPPVGISKLNPLELPLLNTLLLLSAGAAVTWGHHALVILPLSCRKTYSGRNASLTGLIIGISLALIFTLFQYIEFCTSPFDISDSVFASTFYMATTFHGLHVIVGAIYLITATYRIYNYQQNRKHHSNLLTSLWYFHFTDVVWLLLYIIMYLWTFG